MSNRRGVRGSSRTVETLENRRLLSVGYAEASALGGAWSGSGILSLTSPPSRVAVGYTATGALVTMPALAGRGAIGSNFSGTTVDSSGILVRTTRYGDANLNGVVNLADFNRLASNFAPGEWQQGDYNYDGVVNLADFNLLTSNFGIGAGPDGPTADDWAALADQTRTLPRFEVTRDGTMTVTGTIEANRIVIDSAAVSQVQAEYSRTPIRRIHVDAGAGDDIIEMLVSLPATLIGGKGNDQIIGGGRADLISGGAGNDFINGGGGNDTIEGLAGDDQLSGSAGADSILGGDGHDVINGGSGDDTLRGGFGNDALSGNDGHNLFYGDSGADSMWGSAGRDRFVCIDDGAVDRINGFAGVDQVRGHDPLDLIDLGLQ